MLEYYKKYEGKWVSKLSTSITYIHKRGGDIKLGSNRSWYSLSLCLLEPCQPKTHTLDCVLVKVGSWGLHVVVYSHNTSMCNSNHPIGMNIKHTTFIQMAQGPSI